LGGRNGNSEVQFTIHAYQSYVKFSILVLGATYLTTKKSMAHLTFYVRDTNVEASAPPSLRCNLASRRGESKINGVSFDFYEDANIKTIKQTHVCGKFAVYVKLEAN